MDAKSKPSCPRTFTQHSQGSLLQGLLRTFGDSCDTVHVIQVAADDVLDPARRLVGYMVGLKTALFHLRYQGNWIHRRDFVLLFHIRYSRIISSKK